MNFTILFAWLIILAIPYLLHLLITSKRNLNHKIPPGPTKFPLIGNLNQIFDFSPRNLWILSQKYGPLMHLEIGPKPILVISSAKIAKEVLKINDFDFCSRPKLSSSNKFSYGQKDISFSPYGDYWREMRKICILHLFSTNRINFFHSVREEEISILIDSISNSLLEKINVTKVVSTLINNVICRVAIGKKCGRDDIEEENFHKLVHETEILFSSFFVSDYFSSLGWIDKIRGLPQRLENAFRKFDCFYDGVIEDHINENKRKFEQEDIVDVLLHMQEDSPYINKTNIKAILKDIFVAGIGTSSAIIIWAMTELVKNSKIMQKVQKELRSYNQIPKDDLHNLQYFNSVVKETLRLHLPVPLLLPREAIRQSKIGEYEIFEKTQVYINAWGIARDPKVWENPQEFLPERFIDSSVDFKGHDFEFIPFGAGRRGCPGMNFGMAIVELVLVNLLYYFDWKLPDGMRGEEMDMDEIEGITVHKRTPLCLVPCRPIYKP